MTSYLPAIMQWCSAMYCVSIPIPLGLKSMLCEDVTWFDMIIIAMTTKHCAYKCISTSPSPNPQECMESPLSFHIMWITSIYGHLPAMEGGLQRGRCPARRRKRSPIIEGCTVIVMDHSDVTLQRSGDVTIRLLCTHVTKACHVL